MNKHTALQLLGGSTTEAALQIGISVSAVSQWPEVLPKRIQDRVLAALARKHLPAEILAAAESMPQTGSAPASAP